MKHLLKFFELLNVNSEILKSPETATRTILQNHYGIGLNVFGEFYYSKDVLVLCGEKLNKNWIFYINIQDANPDILKRGNFGVYVYYPSNSKIKEVLELLEISESK